MVRAHPWELGRGCLRNAERVNPFDVRARSLGYNTLGYLVEHFKSEEKSIL